MDHCMTNEIVIFWGDYFCGKNCIY